jgi:peptidoglycan LD-endopeptidase LytH
MVALIRAFFLFVVLGFLMLSVAGCISVATPHISVGITQTVRSERSTEIRTLLPTSTPSATITSTPRPTSTKTLVPPTPTETFTTTPTPWFPLYFFPIQPPEVAKYSQGHHDYPAVDIWAPLGSAFVAVTSGTIDYVSLDDDWDPAVNDPDTRGGLSIALIGGDGVRYYGSHLSEVVSGIKPGAWVEAGQILGYVGNSGNARSVPHHLHFGISHPTYPEDWEIRRGEIDPYPYLKAWAVGEMSTPLFSP